jgi:GntR family transcriptional regulator
VVSRLPWRQIESDIRSKILSGEYPRGSQLPSVRKLADAYGVSHGTVGKAVRSLAAEGLLQTEQGYGVFVTE